MTVKPVCLLVLLVLCSPVPAADTLVPKAPDVKARAWLLQDFDSGRVLVESNAQEQLEPASLTKMMTAYVAFSELGKGNIRLQDQVLVSEKAWRTGGSKMFIEVNKHVSVEDLLKGVIVQSGNDASVAIAEYIAGEEAAFSGLMNQYAARLGMNETNFVNATGLPAANHYTTARDLARLASALVRDFPELYKWHAIREFAFNDIVQLNRNKLLWRDDTVDGIKTGHTSSAGYCLVASALRNEMRLISVVVGSASEKSRAQQSQALLNYGFRFFETHRLYGAHEPVTSVRVWKGQTENLSIGLSHDLYVTVPRGQYKKLDASVEIETDIIAPVLEGETRGKMMLRLGDDILVERPLIALEAVGEGSLWRRVTDNVKLLFQ